MSSVDVAAAGAVGCNESLVQLLSSKIVRGSLKSVENSLWEAWQVLLAATHHHYVMSGFQSSPVMHRIIPLAVKLLEAPCDTLSTAQALPLLLVVLVHGSTELVSLVVDELAQAPQSPKSGVAESEEVAKPGRGSTQVVGSLTSALIAAVQAPCCRSAQDEANLAAAASERFASSEALATTLADGVLRQSLLRVKERDAEPEAWAWLERTVDELLTASLSPCTSGAQCLVLYLAKGLSKVAGASQNTELTCGQRELAVRLLSRIACQSFPKMSCGPEKACKMLQTCQADAHIEDHEQLLYKHLIRESCFDKGTACSAAFLLCLWTEGRENAKTAKKRRPSERKSAKADSKESWKVAAIQDFQRSLTFRPTSGGKTQPAVAIAAQELYQSLLLPENCTEACPDRATKGLQSPFWKARSVALWALLSLLKSSPFAHVRKQALSGVAGACASNPPAPRSVGDAAATLALKDESAWIRGAAVDCSDQLFGGNKASVKAAVAVKLSDPVAAVRRAAFRVSCSVLKPWTESSDLVSQSGDLIRLCWEEPPQTQELVFQAVSQALLPQSGPSRLPGLAELMRQPGVGAKGLRRLLGAHHADLTAKAKATKGKSPVPAFTKICQETMQVLCKQLEAKQTDPDIQPQASLEDVVPWTLMLEYAGQLEPFSVDDCIPAVIGWLQDASSSATALSLVLARSACRILCCGSIRQPKGPTPGTRE